MGIADKHRMKTAVVAPETPIPQIDILDYFLDGTFPRTIQIASLPDIQYIPLTLAEELELKPRPELRVIRMMAKALRYRLEKSIENPAKLLLDINLSADENIEKFFGELPRTKNEVIRLAIDADIIGRMNSLIELFEKNAEEYNQGDSPGINRKRNVLDSFTTVEHTFKDSSYKLNDFANMTALQYKVFLLTRMEVNVRSNNDHEAMTSKAGTNTSKTNTGKRKTVGS